MKTFPCEHYHCVELIKSFKMVFCKLFNSFWIKSYGDYNSWRRGFDSYNPCILIHIVRSANVKQKCDRVTSALILNKCLSKICTRVRFASLKIFQTFCVMSAWQTDFILRHPSSYLLPRPKTSFPLCVTQ